MTRTTEEPAQMDWAHGTPIMIGPWLLGLGDPSPETVEYWEGVAARKLMLKVCQACGRFNHPRRLFCLTCQSDAFTWQEAKGTGSVYTFSMVTRAPTEAFQREAPYTVGIIELDEGVFFCSRVIAADQSAVAIGSPVTLAFAQVGTSGELPVFELATG
jgi:uncharacterized protein